MNYNDIIIQPVVSEKSTGFLDTNKYAFRVSMDANKIVVRQAIKKIFGVQPESVNIIIVRGKRRRLRYKFGKTPAWKKAIVTLKAGDKIEVFES